MEKTASFKNFIFALLIALGGAAAGVLSPALLVFAAAGTVFLAVRYGKSYAAVPFVFTLIAVFLSHLGNDIMLYTICCAFIIFCLVAYGGFALRLPYRIIALALAFFALIALYLAFGLPSLLAGKPPYEGILSSLRTLDEQYRSMGYIVEDIVLMRESLPDIFYGMLIMLAEAAAFATVFLSCMLCRLSKSGVRTMARFREWQLPSNLKLGVPVFAAAIIIMYAAKLNGATVILYTVLYMLLPLFAAAGVATVCYLASRGRERLTVPAKILITLAAVLSPYMMALLGVIDLYAGIRRKLIRTDRLIKEAFEKARREKSSVVTVDFGDGNGPQIIARRKDSAFFDHMIEDGADDDDDEDDEADGKSDDEPMSGSEKAAISDASESETPADTDKNTTNTDKNSDGGEE